MAILCRFLLLKRQRIADSSYKSANLCRSLGKFLWREKIAKKSLSAVAAQALKVLV